MGLLKSYLLKNTQLGFPEFIPSTAMGTLFWPTQLTHPSPDSPHQIDTYILGFHSLILSHPCVVAVSLSSKPDAQLLVLSRPAACCGTLSLCGYLSQGERSCPHHNISHFFLQILQEILTCQRNPQISFLFNSSDLGLCWPGLFVVHHALRINLILCREVESQTPWRVVLFDPNHTLFSLHSSLTTSDNESFHKIIQQVNTFVRFFVRKAEQVSD